MKTSIPRNQGGAALFIALIMLLLVTMLAISSLRDVTLESRMTANSIENKRLTNAAEAGLRAGEGSIGGALVSPDSTSDCSDTKIPCIPYASKTSSNDYTTPKFSDTAKLASYAPTDGTVFKNPAAPGATATKTNIQWYAVPVGSTCVEDNCALTGKGAAFFYEVNSCASATNCKTTDGSVQLVMLRSILAKVFN
ncbi:MULTISPECIES: PilX N-terminal domain-containing pilus assembly protein [unclassified Pseudomonas]|uniref:pilus assembly PilX family protein n=1 Tax=unclassified Pseudomonas TaxID=196821 RepID=UPI0002A313A5|nr:MULTISPECIES: PilX N-terminal domain-containing pilus assembly protein [unclassified Pseudomonas]NTX90170.1 pilus assembly protein PilX [Pseudomonas sp. UMA643]NTY20696.1 pilus assembly protein PilX [Pseudomonas sp. UMC3103]NTY26034.1 pilus assembly protein PilX [Pseudomonas sp. UMA603]NTY30360.1 pilus assembly protein PilX [Pseudomonas sp. UMC3129]NTY56164.1 pilus assembly protein PilX [Pseudomonas sp. UMC631]